mmetsp:Transcript_26832/g.75878  ORF Transcript_26832/g.75878 Transcript_26832/m.75878 type:complete len:217 (-) Transcript_26832:103-753(-)
MAWTLNQCAVVWVALGLAPCLGVGLGQGPRGPTAPVAPVDIDIDARRAAAVERVRDRAHELAEYQAVLAAEVAADQARMGAELELKAMHEKEDQHRDERESLLKAKIDAAFKADASLNGAATADEDITEEARKFATKNPGDDPVERTAVERARERSREEHLYDAIDAALMSAEYARKKDEDTIELHRTTEIEGRQKAESTLKSAVSAALAKAAKKN